jgi:hypothetical protein
MLQPVDGDHDVDRDVFQRFPQVAEPGAAAQVGRDLDAGGGRLVHLLDQAAVAQGRHFGPVQGPLAMAVQVGIGGDRADP